MPNRATSKNEPTPDTSEQEHVEQEELAADDAMKVELKSDEPSLFEEGDAPHDARPRLEGPVNFNTDSTTLNAQLTADGKLLMALTEGGLGHLIAGARANTGQTAGRYMYEVCIIESTDFGRRHARSGNSIPSTLVRVGFSVAGAFLLLADGEDSLCFDSQGNFVHGKSRKRFAKFGRNQAIAVLLNLDKASPTFETVSLFVEGVRAGDPQKLPEALKGKALFPVA